MSARLFAVDLGASGGKCFVGTLEAGSFSMEEVHRFPHEGVNFYLPDRSGQVTERTYWDDILLYQNILEGLKEARRKVGASIDAIGIDTWGADGHFVTEEGDILGKVYCYRDHRLDNMVEALKAKVDPRQMYEITGIHFEFFNVSNQLYWYAMNRPGLLRQAYRFLPVPTLFHYYLGAAPKIDSTWASITQLMDIRSGTWSKDILDRLGIPLEIMPEIVPPGSVIGELSEPLAKAVDMPRAKLVAVGSHDTASAFAAAPVENPEEALIISSGTWSLVGKLTAEPVTTSAAMEFHLSNEGGIGNIRLLRNCMGTWLVQELRRVWKEEDGREMEWPEITKMAKSAPAFGSLIDPDNPGFYNPANMQDAIADFCRETNQDVPQDRAAYARCVYESLALKYRLVNENLCRVSGSESRVVHVVGGGCKNDLLNQFTSNATDLPVVAGPDEATAAGNLLVQAMGLGMIGSMADGVALIRDAFPIKEFKPENAAEWDQAYERFCAHIA